MASRGGAEAEPEVKHPTLRTGTKQALLISMLQRPEGATMQEIIAATGWQAHSARGAMSGALGKKLGLVVVSARRRCAGQGVSDRPYQHDAQRSSRAWFAAQIDRCRTNTP
ncbi:MAG: DUF3489 domain-containing protein [Cypionkella sp.]